ncbi:hypothetical protein ACTD5D_22735 [Nocardia takedensis]
MHQVLIVVAFSMVAGAVLPLWSARMFPVAHYTHLLGHAHLALHSNHADI